MTNTPGNADWQAESIRLTVFPSPGAAFDSYPSFAAIAGAEPLEEMRQPAVGRIRASGQLGDCTLLMERTPARVDLHLERTPSADPQAKPESRLGLSVMLDRFEGPVVALLGSSIPTSRLAFGAVLIAPVSEKVDGYKKLEPYLPSLQLDPVGSSELIYQINRPRKSTIDGLGDLDLNRLSKWGVVVHTYVYFALGQQPAAIGRQQLEIAARLELDLSTSAEYGRDLPADKLLPLYRELLQLAREISDRGDVA